MPEMKNSGVEWIGEIPAEWDICKMKYCLDRNDGGVWGTDPANSEKDKIVLRSTEQTIDGNWDISNPAMRNIGANCQQYKIKKGDLLITKSSGSSLHIGKTTLADDYFNENECYYSNFLQRLRANEMVVPKFLWYLMNNPIVREQFVFMQNSTIGIGNINADNINAVIIPLPPLKKQEKIIAHLDQKCSEIDSLSADIQSQIDVLEEYKKSVITEAVTKGLNPDVEMKDSGIEWIGTVNKNYDVKKLKYVCDILDSFRQPVTAHLRSQDSDVLYDYYGASGVIDKIDGYTIDDDVLLIGEDGANLRMRNLPLVYQVHGKAWINNHAHIIKPIATKLNYLYAYFMLESLDINPYITGSAQPKFNQEYLQNMYVIIPPIHEQQQIANYLDTKCAKIEAIIADKKAQLETLAEYKKCLIYEYVTGKKEAL